MRQQTKTACVFLAATLFCLGVARDAARAGAILFDARGQTSAHIEFISETPAEIVLEMHLGGLRVDTVLASGVAWSCVGADGMGLTSQSGWPQLPEQSVWVIVPSGGVRLDITGDSTSRFSWAPPEPAPQPVNRAEAAALPRVPDREFYAGRTIYPDAPVTISLSGGLAATRVALVTFTPVQYDAASRQYLVHTYLRVRLLKQDGAHLDAPGGHPRTLRDLAERIAINPQPGGEPDSTSGPRMLLVTEPLFLDALEPFVAWKTRSGIPVRTVIYSQVSGSASELQSVVRGLCDTATVLPEFLLIVGDVDRIPAFSGVQSSLTDHPYSLLDDADYLPDISVGRIPVQTAAECSTWVSRSLAIERDALLPVTLSGMVFSSSAGYDPRHGVTVTGLFQNAGMSVDRFQQPATGALSGVMSSLNAGKQWAFYIGHGYSQAWSSVDPSFTNVQTDQLLAETAPVVVSVACATADLDYPGGSLAEYWLTRPGLHGPLAYFGATESTAFFRSDTLGLGMLRAIFEQGCERLGPAADLGRLAAAQCFPQGPGGLTEETIQQFILIGDPSARAFTQPPRPLTVTHADIVPVGSQAVTVSVQRDGQPLAGAEVCMDSGDSTYYAVRLTDATGAAVFPRASLSPAHMLLTVTARNAVPYLGSLHVVRQSGPFAQVSQMSVLDSAGDDDGNADRGEIIALRFHVANLGNYPSSPSTLIATSASPGLTIHANALPVPSVSGYDTIGVTGVASAVVADSASDGSIALVNTVLISQAGDTSRRVFSVTLHAPVMQFVSSALLEDFGDGDGNPEAGERIALRLRFANRGGETARQVACTLTSLPPELTCDTSFVDRNELSSRDTLAATFRLLAPTTLPRGYPLEFSYSLSAANTRPLSGWGVERVGRVPVYLFVLDPVPEQVDAVSAALTSLGVEWERGASLPSDLARYASVWIFCGVYPNSVPLSASDAVRLAAYLDARGNCYWEGGDVWAFQTSTALHPYFGIRGLSDGTSDAGPIVGEPDSPLSGCTFDYQGENSFIDRLAPEGGAHVILRNARPTCTYAVCIANSGLACRTVGSSVEIGCLADSLYPATRVHVVRAILDWFGIESRADIYPPVILHQPLTAWNAAEVPIPITADIQDASGIAQAAVEYQVGEGPSLAEPLMSEDGLFRGWLPGAPFGSRISYRLVAADNAPLRNSAATDLFTIDVQCRREMPLSITFSQATRAALAPHLEAGQECHWAVTQYPEDVPVLELHSSAGQRTAFTTDVFDCAALKDVNLSFWHYLREAQGAPGVLARITGSADGGATFPHTVWEVAATGGGVAVEGTVAVPHLAWMIGHSAVALRFEFFGDWYWRLRDIQVSGPAMPTTAPVHDLVISVIPRGIQLTWKKHAGALRYDVLATESSELNAPCVVVAETADTTWVDSDLRFGTRFYEVRAVTEESVWPKSVHDIEPQHPAAIRTPDIIWNLKRASATHFDKP